ncbi:hypothetical protein CGRA01v4_01140 [Colletotrichum graminicola]|nr:hypothetical protein CGRA01v4_01140 [Colletotrichum graminicola]
MPPSTIVGILKHVTCSFHFHRDLCMLREPEMMILDPVFGSDPNDDVDESPSTQDSGVCLPDDEAIAGQHPWKQECLEYKAISSSAVMWLLEAGLDTLMVDRRRSADIQTIQAMGSPPLAHLIPEIFNIKIQSLASRSHLLPGLSSVFAVLDEIESRRIQDLIEDRVDSQPSEANSHSSENFWRQLWRLTRTKLPPFQRGDLQQRGVREAAASDDDALSTKEVERSSGYQPLSRDRTYADEASNHEVGAEIGTCESYDIQDHFSDSGMGQHEDDVDESAPEANDTYRYSSPFLSMDDISIQYEGEVGDDDACHVEHAVDYDDKFVSFSSGVVSSPFVPFSREASPEDFEAKDLDQTDLEDNRKLGRKPISITCSTDSQAIAAYAQEPFNNWWSSDVDSGEEQSATSDNTSGLRERISTLPRSDCDVIMVGGDDAIPQSQIEREGDAESDSRNDDRSFEGYGDTSWGPSQTRRYSAILLEEIEMEGHSEDEWAL